MKKVVLYVLCMMLMVSMALTSGCGACTNEPMDVQRETEQSVESTEESTGVLEDVAKDVRRGAEELMEGETEESREPQETEP